MIKLKSRSVGWTTMTRDIQEADLVIAFYHKGGIKAIKNRNGNTDEKLDMAEVLEMLLPYQPDALQSPIRKWIKEAQRYLSMKAFW